MGRETTSSEFCEELFESEEERLIMRRLLEDTENDEIIRELLQAKSEESKK